MIRLRDMGYLLKICWSIEFGQKDVKEESMGACLQKRPFRSGLRMFHGEMRIVAGKNIDRGVFLLSFFRYMCYRILYDL